MHNFGSVEYWLTVVKVSAIVGFIIVGLSRIFGIVGDPVGLHNVTGLAGGFLPNGFSGVWMAVLMVQIARRGLTSTNRTRIMCLSLFWHFLDVVWLCVFTVVYLMGAM